MERSHSFNNCDMSNNENNNNSNNNNVSSLAATAINLRKAIEMRQTQLQKQRNILVHSGSNDIDSNLNDTTATCRNFTSSSLYITKNNNVMRTKTPLQRQKSVELTDDIDYAAYATDFEEEDEEEEEEEEDGEYDDIEDINMNVGLPKTATTTTAQYDKRHFQFHKHKPLSDNSILLTSTPLPLPTSLPPLSLPLSMPLNAFAAATSTGTSTSHFATASSNPHSTALKRRRHLKHEESFDSTATTDSMSPLSERRHQQIGMLKRDNSTHSDSSRYSSVDSLLESRKPDPEAILINLGFGPVDSEDILSRIPKRFLKPSQVRGIDTDAFIKRLQLASTLADHSALGYRGLTGNPDVQPSSIVAKIMQRFEVNQRKKSVDAVEHTIR